MIDFVTKLWRGQKSLILTFWGLYFFGWLLLASVDLLLFNEFSNSFLMFPISGVFSILIIIPIWRSSGNYISELKNNNKGKKIWGYFARGISLFGVVRAFATFYFQG